MVHIFPRSKATERLLGWDLPDNLIKGRKKVRLTHLLSVQCDESAPVQSKVEVGVVAAVHQVGQVGQVLHRGGVEGLDRQHGQLVAVVDLVRQDLWGVCKAGVV